MGVGEAYIDRDIDRIEFILHIVMIDPRSDAICVLLLNRPFHDMTHVFGPTPWYGMIEEILYESETYTVAHIIEQSIGLSDVIK